MTDLILYNYWRSSTSFRVRLALEMKKLAYDYRSVHLLNGEQHKEDYRKLNPLGGVPTLVHGDRVLSQSFAIIEYLDEAFPNTYQLLPKDIFERARVRQFCEMINADIHAYGNLKTLQYLQKNHDFSEDQKNKWVSDWFLAGMKACETFLEKTAGTYCFGNQITAAEMFLVPQVTTAHRFKLDTTVFKTTARIFEACQKHEAFIKAHPFRQTDTPPEFKV